VGRRIDLGNEGLGRIDAGEPASFSSLGNHPEACRTSAPSDPALGRVAGMCSLRLSSAQPTLSLPNGHHHTRHEINNVVDEDLVIGRFHTCPSPLTVKAI
jgi:hypothetical protein